MAGTESTTEITKNKPAYVSFPTFLNFIQRLKSHTVPPQIDKTMMDNLSGGVQSHLLSALRFLGLVEGEDCDVTPALEKLVESHGTESFGSTLEAVIDDAYAGVIGDLDITKATAGQLSDAFGKRHREPSMRERAERFYLRALDCAGAQKSPYFGKRKSAKANGATRRKPKPPQGASTGGGQPDPENKHAPKPPEVEPKVPAGTQQYPLYFRGKVTGSLTVPTNLTLADCKVIELQLAVLKAYAAEESTTK